jgi:hypothetical protein
MKKTEGLKSRDTVPLTPTDVTFTKRGLLTGVFML